MSLAAAFEAGTINYDRYIGLACLEVSLDNAQLIDRLTSLIVNPDLRERMGAAGRQRIAQVFDWAIVMKQHLELWRELERIRREMLLKPPAALSAAPKCTPARQDPYRVFKRFTTEAVDIHTLVMLSQTLGVKQTWSQLLKDPLFSYARDYLPDEAALNQVLSLLADKSRSVADLAENLGLGLSDTIRLVAPLAKVGFIAFVSASSQ